MSASPRLQKLLAELGERVKRANDLQAQPNEALEPPLAAPEPSKTAPTLAELDLVSSLAEAPTGPLKPKEPPPPSLQVNPEEITQRLTAEIKEHLEPLPKKAQALVVAFHTAALEAAVKQNMKLRHLSEVALFAPLEAVAAKLGVDRVTIWRWFEKYPILHKIIARREHYGSVTSFTTGKAMTWKTGTVWVVRLKPNLDTEARVRFYHLKYPWRDLERDIKRGHTASRLHEEECNDQRDLEELVRDLRKELLNWTLPPPLASSPLPDRCTARRVAHHELTGAVLDVQGAPRAKRNETVDAAARTVAAALGDGHLDVWRWVLWQLLRLDYQGENYFIAVANVLTRAVVDREEDFARSAGALAISRLKASGIWERLKQAPPFRIANAPALA